MHLPLDDTLRRFFDGTSLMVPSSFEWTDTPAHEEQLIEALERMDLQEGDRLVARLHMGMLLADPFGKQAMYQALTIWAKHVSPAKREQVLAGLASCRSDRHRSFWLFVRHPQIFDLAVSIDVEKPSLQHMQQHALGPGRAIKREASAMTALCDEIHASYKQELGPHPIYAAYLHDRQAEPQMLTVNVKGKAASHASSCGDVNGRKENDDTVEASSISMMVEYCERTGVARTFIAGGFRQHTLLARAFEKHLLKNPQRQIETPKDTGSSSAATAPTLESHKEAAGGEAAAKVQERQARKGPFSEDFRWVHLPDWPYGPIALSLTQAAVLRSMWSFGGQPQLAERIMTRAGSRSDKPMDVFKLKSINKGDPRYEGPLYAYRTLVQVNRQEGTYAMPCAGL